MVGVKNWLRRDGELHEPEEETRAAVEETPALPVREVFRRFWPYARPYRRWVPLILLLAALGPAIETAGIWMFGYLVDDVLVTGDFGPLAWILLAYLGITLAGGVVSFFDDYLSDWVGERFILSLREDLFRHLHGLSLGFFERRKLGDVVGRLSGDVAAIESLVLSGVASAIAYAFQALFFVGALFYLRWELALVSLLALPLFLAAARRFSAGIKAAAREQRRRAGSIGAVAEESFSNAALVQAYGRQEDEAERFRRETMGSFRAHMAATRLEAAFSPLVGLLEVAGVLAVISFGAWQLSEGRISLGGLLVFVAFLTRLYEPIGGLGSLANTVWAASASAERLIELLDERPSVEERPGSRPLGRARGFVELDGVSFHYPGTGRPALEAISLRVNPGETLALVGPSGSGKSTVAKLLLRFYDPDAGRVLLDGHDLRDLTLPSVRENVAVLLQETLVFDGTVRENIAYGSSSGATEEEVVRAARLADADEFIRRLPDGYGTRVGQKGRRLSGGQLRRVALARAVIRDAPVMILDEPTTGLDAESARRVVEAVQRLAEDRAIIVVSHDPAVVREATRIAVLEEGRVAETGTHGELLARDGAYATLHRLRGAKTGQPEDHPPPPANGTEMSSIRRF